MSYQHLLARALSTVAAASLLAACQGGSATAPAVPAQSGVTAPQSLSSSALSGSRAVADAHHGSDKDDKDGKTRGALASPASLHFTADQAAAGTPQTVTVSAKSDEKLYVSIAGTGNCPAVSPTELKPKSGHDGHDAKTAVITVTPSGAGPATCVITVSDRDDIARAHAGGRHDADNDRDHHDGDKDCDHHDDDTFVIPVSVDAAPTPPPSPTPTPCGARGC